MNVSVFGWLAGFAFLAALVCAAVASVFVRRLLQRPPTPAGERIGSVKSVMHKVRKGEPMSADEVDFALKTIAERRSPMAYSIPAGLFAIGSLYVFGRLDQLHGAAPSWATFIGVLPMLAAVNLTAQLHRIGNLHKRARQLKPDLSTSSGTGPRTATE
ncbi:hypothetical protein [Mycobacterium sp. DBP42]|uniref:hypothetical protein n=1 Tax=Mycobacterium sp. DBP42 TaxID=2545267 RepID=UPI00110CA75C|nr:hypothetical protein [Mycobacterium sp. DBP42]TMS50095.1 hypothetical protein E0T84_25105 [Mycobacterium sp. DBP42]